MSHITNPHFTEQEKMLLEFILQYDFAEKEFAVTRLNSLKAEEIIRDVTPYYHIMEFRTPDIPEGYDGMREVMHLQVARDGMPTSSTCINGEDRCLNMRSSEQTALLLI